MPFSSFILKQSKKFSPETILQLQRLGLLTIFCCFSLFIIASIAFMYHPVYAIKMLLTSLVPVPLYLFIISVTCGKIFRLLIVSLGIWSGGVTAMNVYYTYMYQKPINGEGYYVIYQSIGHVGESLDWINSNLSLSGVLLIVFVIIFSWFIIRYTINVANVRQSPRITLVLLFVALVSTGIGMYRWPSVIEFSSKHHTFAFALNYISYREMLDELSSIQKELSSVNVDASYAGSDPSPIFIVVIGESVTRHHMGIYGYNRETTPGFSKIENLFVFNNITSTSASTVSALANALTFKKNGKYTASIVDVFNAAGFITELYSNHAYGGSLDNPMHYMFGNVLKNYYPNRYGFYIEPDEILLPNIEKAILNSDSMPRVIFVHLQGSHVDYADRYPQSFSIFNDEKQIEKKDFIPSMKKNYAKNRINSYDNSILYNDYIVSEIIEMAKKTNRYSYVLYFSDHGEENYDFRNYAGRGGDNSKYIYDVPLLLWESQACYTDHASIFSDISILDRSYSTGNLAHTILDLSSISTPLFDSKLSVISKNYIPLPRTTDNGVYEDIFH